MFESDTNIQATRELIAQGADVNYYAEEEGTALDLAIQSEAFQTCKLLIESGADFNVLYDDGEETFALGLAIDNGVPEICKLLRLHGAHAT
jgi:ankyrin repeat protein